MPTTIIFGGGGKVALHLTRILIAKNHTVHSIIRNPAQCSTLESLGAHPIVQSIEESSVSDLTKIIRDSGADTVVWSAGAGGGDPDRTRRVDQEGAIKSIDAAADAKRGMRYIIVSAIDTRDREKGPTPDWYTDEDIKKSNEMWKGLDVYMHAKFAADKELRTGNERRGLRYTIVRPGALTTESATGKISAGKGHFGKSVTREDVADVVAAVIENEGTVGLAFDVTGGETEVTEAVDAVARGKIDAFQGMF